jgi:two-component system, chemotaxis family, sensor kinase CheA
VLKRLPIRLKLILLAGVPVIGALVLATIIARDAQRQAESAAAIGSIEDLARLSAEMSALVHALQFERNELSLRIASKTLVLAELTPRFTRTDAARKKLDDFLATRRVSSLPPRLARDLSIAKSKLSGLQKERDAAASGKKSIDETLGYYKATDLALISATAALAQLADDGELMRAIAALVIVLQIKERASQEHALLSHVFALNEFPAGTYKDLVTLTTEEAAYVTVLEVDATDSVNARFRAITRSPEFERTAALRKVALDTLSDEFHTDPVEWSNDQGKKIERLRDLEMSLNQAVEAAALAKVHAAARAVRLSYGLGGVVIVLSALLAGLIARGISHSVGSLAHAAQQVRERKDFAVRAVKTSEDELGRLTDAFNEMLSGIQARDDELRHHRENLEQLVTQRTLALQRRNEAMRLVLDNVDQGLATIELDGTLSSERSRAFDAWFGGAGAEGSFAERLARNDKQLRGLLKLGWEQVLEGYLPVECAIAQLPQRIRAEDREYAVTYKAIVEHETLRGALLVVSDVTDEMARLRRDAEQRELIGIFESVMNDRAGFVAACKECEELVRQVTSGNLVEPALAMRAVHTLKGNCGVVGITSVAEVAHQLESAMVESGGMPSSEQTADLARSWRELMARTNRLLGAESEAAIEITPDELHQLQATALSPASQLKLPELLERMKHERAGLRLRRVAEQAKTLARRLQKGELEVHIEASPDVRFDPEVWGPFWSATVHVLRNALSHGIETPEERVAAGKPEHGKLTLAIARSAKSLTIEISDDGRGIDWARVREKAILHGLPHADDNDLTEALFSDGLSTAESLTSVAGRGVGMSAMRDAARRLGGTVTVMSTPGVGTTVRFQFPGADSPSGALAPRAVARNLTG